ncbi:hypothetical protein BDV19DRAFT_362194 [Aspergillus venezuelensis]
MVMCHQDQSFVVLLLEQATNRWNIPIAFSTILRSPSEYTSEIRILYRGITVRPNSIDNGITLLVLVPVPVPVVECRSRVPRTRRGDGRPRPHGVRGKKYRATIRRRNAVSDLGVGTFGILPLLMTCNGVGGYETRTYSLVLDLELETRQYIRGRRRRGGVRMRLVVVVVVVIIILRCLLGP